MFYIFTHKCTKYMKNKLVRVVYRRRWRLRPRGHKTKRFTIPSTINMNCGFPQMWNRKKKRKITQKKNKRKKRKSEHKSKSHVRPADRSVLFCPVHTTCVRKELWREASRLITAHFQKPIPVKQKRGKESEKLCVVLLPFANHCESSSRINGTFHVAHTRT